MQPSAEEAAQALRGMDRQRRAVARRAAPGWPLMFIGVVMLATIGLTEDLAPDWSGTTFLMVGGLGLVVGLAGRTRRGAALLGRRAQPRALALGIGPKRASRARRLLVRASYAALCVAAAIVVGLTVAAGAGGDRPAGSARTWWPDGLPHTVEYLAIGILLCAVLLGYGRWRGRESMTS